MSTITDINSIRNSLINTISDLVGDNLSKILLNGTTEVPSVIKDITGGNLPEYPFIVVANSLTTPLQGTKMLNQYFDCETEELVIVYQNYVTLTVKCWGENSLAILNDLLIKVNHATPRWSMELGAKASFMSFTAPQYIPTYLSTSFVETSEMDATFSLRTEYRPSTGTYIGTVNATGDYNTGSNPTTPDYEETVKVNTELSGTSVPTSTDVLPPIELGFWDDSFSWDDDLFWWDGTNE